MLMSFSIPEQISLLLSGKKRQTTRTPGRYKVGDILHCWYKPRQKKTCGNCLVPVCKTYYAMEFGGSSQKEKTCSEHRNFFGKANARIIIHCGEKKFSQGIEYDHLLAIDGVELHIDYLGNQNEAFLESWAHADGFANFQEAHKWFLKSTKNPQWMYQEWDIIVFEPEWGINGS